MRDKIDQLQSAGQGLIGKTYNKNDKDSEQIESAADQTELKKKFDKQMRQMQTELKKKESAKVEV